MGSESILFLIHRGCSQTSEIILDTLALVIADGTPKLRWAVSWRGGVSHADGAGGDKPIPPELLPTLTADSLMKWISRFLGDDSPTAELSALKKDKRVIAWCDQVRRMFPA